MQLYCGTTSQFVDDTLQNRITGRLEEAFFTHFRYRPSHSEVNSWRNSLRAMCNVVQYARLDDNGLVLEYQLPLTSKRLDFMITGRDALGAANAVIVELKQWSEAQASNVDGCVATFVAGAVRDELHPSVQVGQYHQYLEDFNPVFSSGDVTLSACSYLHNWSFDARSEFFSSRHSSAIARYPLFAGDQTTGLATFMTSRVDRGGGSEVLQTVLQSKYKASKKLMEHVAGVIAGRPEYVLLDEQLVVFETVLGIARSGLEGTPPDGAHREGRAWHRQVGDRPEPHEPPAARRVQRPLRHRLAGVHGDAPGDHRAPRCASVHVLQLVQRGRTGRDRRPHLR